METLIWILVLAAIAGAVFWNHKNGEMAMQGVEFDIPAPVDEVVLAIWSAHSGSVKAKAKARLYGVTVARNGEASFEVKTKLDDIGRIEVEESGDGLSSVRAFTDELYIGTHPVAHWRSGIMGLASRLTHTTFKVLGVAPNAARLKRFQNSLQGRLMKQMVNR